MESILSSVSYLYTGLKNMLRLFREARGYIDLEVRSSEKSFTEQKNMSEQKFLQWILSHSEPMMHSLHVVGKNADATKTVRADFLLSELPFTNKDVGITQLRATLERVHKAHEKDEICVSTSYMDRHTVNLPREMEVTLVYATSLTPESAKHLREFKAAHPRLTVVELSLDRHLRKYILDHPYMPRNLRRLDKEKTKLHTPKAPVVCNNLMENSVEVVLVGGVPGDMVESTIAMKNGVNLVQYWRIVAQPKDSKKK